MTRLRAQDGFSLIELLVSCGLMIIVLSATLGALDVFGSTTATNQKVSDAQDQARNTLDRMSWELRNATAYQIGAGTGSAILRADPWDIIFKSVDPSSPGSANNPNSVQRIRYCLDSTGDTLYRETQLLNTSPVPNMPATADCPGPADSWPTRTAVATNVVNDGRRVFTYNRQDQDDVNAPMPDYPDIAGVRAKLFVDVNPGKAPAETALATGVFLRNQNRRPVASCTATPTGNGHVFLNASASVDPEGGLLTYVWSGAAGLDQKTAPNFDYTPATPGSYTFSVTVTDNSQLTSQATCAPDPVNIQ